jgi:hypothetical protein
MENTDNQQERLEQELGWLAGAYDGEGCFNISLAKVQSRKRYYLYPMIAITNTDYTFTDEVMRLLKKYKIPFYANERIPHNTKHKKSMGIYIKGLKRIQTFLNLLNPYIIRRERFKVLSEFVDRRVGQNCLPARWKHTYTPRDLELCNKLRKLNGSKPLESSETIRKTLTMVDEDIVRTVQRCTESTRNELTA